MAKSKAASKTGGEGQGPQAPAPKAEAPKGNLKILGTYGTMYYVKDMKKAVEFFSEKLGAKPGMQSPEWTEFPFGGHALCLHAYKDDKSPAANGSLILHVEDIRAFVAHLKAKLARVEEPREVHPGAWSADFVDPEGNHISLYQGPKSA